MLLGEDAAHQADDGAVVGKDAYDVSTTFDFLVQALLGVVAPDLSLYASSVVFRVSAIKRR